MYGAPPTPQTPASPAPSPTLVPVKLDAVTAPPNLPAGVSPRVINFDITKQGISPRLGISLVGSSDVSSSHSLFNNDRGYVISEWYASAAAGTYDSTVVAMSQRTIIWWDQNSGFGWRASAFSSAISNTTPANGAFDAAVVYNPVFDENVVVFGGAGNARAPYWEGPNAASSQTFSTLTNSPLGATWLIPYDARLVFGIERQWGNTYLTNRVTWSARGDIYTYTEPSGGAEDLTDMRGGITRLIDDGNRILVFSEREIWEGVTYPFPFDFDFRPLDRTIGCTDGRTAQKTPLGVIFQGGDDRVYLLPKGSSKAQAIGGNVFPLLKQHENVSDGGGNATSPLDRKGAFAVYHSYRNAYELFPCTDTAAGVLTFPNVTARLNLDTLAWSVCSYRHAISAAGMIQQESIKRGAVCYVSTSSGTIGRMGEPFLRSLASGSTTDLGSAFSASALFPIGNPNPSQKLYVDSVLVDYSNFTCGSGSSITIACSKDFGQTYDLQVGVALPQALYSQQTVVNLGYSAVYPSIEVRYESQKSGFDLCIQRITAMVAGVGQPGLGG